jgi:4-aminobutyrate aminotransferase-like enzyme
LRRAAAFVNHVEELNARYRKGEIRVNMPQGFGNELRSFLEAAALWFPASHAALTAARQGLFYSLPVAFDPFQSVGPYLAAVDRDERGEPYRFLDMGALIATQAFGENEPAIVEAMLRMLPYVVSKYAHSEYQTHLSLHLKSLLSRIAPAGTPRYFIVNTGSESVENAIKAVLLNRVRGAGEKDGGFIISFAGAFHGRTLGSLAVTHRKKAKIGFPTFQWPQVPFPMDDPGSASATLRREETSLRQIFELITSGKLTSTPMSRDAFQRLLERIDAYLARSSGAIDEFLKEERSRLSTEEVKKARRVAAVLVEPIQGEGGIQAANPRFFRRLRLLTKIYDVPLIFDEVQTGFGATGRLWAHELFDLPLPPDAVTWAKKAQNGVLFVSDELAAFFQEEKKFNTTWEGDSAGMVRLLAILDKLDLAQIRITGAHARKGLDSIAMAYPELIQNVRGAGVMLGFDVGRADWRDELREQSLRGGLILLPCGERALRFYPRYNTEPYAIDEAFDILRSSISAVLAKDALRGGSIVSGEKITIPLARAGLKEFDQAGFGLLKAGIVEVEDSYYGPAAHSSPDARRISRRSRLRYPDYVLESSIANAGSAGVALIDNDNGRVIAYALGSPLENYDETGMRDDKHFGEQNTFYLQAAAMLPSVLNREELLGYMLEKLRERLILMGYEHLSALMEAEVLALSPPWLRNGTVTLTVDNYLRSGIKFVYVQVPLKSTGEVPAAVTAAVNP